MIVELISNLPGWLISILSFMALYIFVNAMIVVKNFMNKNNSRFKGDKYTG